MTLQQASLSRIQAAHGLASQGQDHALEYKLQLQMLKGAVEEANDKLVDLQRLVEAQEKARCELGD